MTDDPRVEAAVQAVDDVTDEDGDGVWIPAGGQLRRPASEMIARAALAAADKAAWQPWSQMPEPKPGDQVWAYSHDEGVCLLTFDHPIHEDGDGPDEEEPPQWWCEGEDVSGPEWKWLYYRPVPDPPNVPRD